MGAYKRSELPSGNWKRGPKMAGFYTVGTHFIFLPLVRGAVLHLRLLRIRNMSQMKIPLMVTKRAKTRSRTRKTSLRWRSRSEQYGLFGDCSHVAAEFVYDILIQKYAAVIFHSLVI